MTSYYKDRFFRHSQITDRFLFQVPRYGDRLDNYSIDKDTGDILFKLPNGSKHRILIDNPMYSINPDFQTRVLEKKPTN